MVYDMTGASNQEKWAFSVMVKTNESKAANKD